MTSDFIPFDENEQENIVLSPIEETKVNLTGFTTFQHFVPQNFSYKGKDIFEGARTGDLPLVYMLLSLGVDIDKTDSNHGTALHWAAYRGHEDICDLLVQRGANVNALTSDEEKQSVLMWAAIEGNLKIVKLLVENGADLDYCDNRGYAAITHAVQNGHLFATHYLYSKGANIDVKDKNDHTLVHWAAYKGHLTILKYLVEKRGLSVNSIDDKHRTALHWAAREGHVDVCKYLIMKGCDISIKDDENYTAKMWAIDRKHDRIADLLKEIENSKNQDIESGVIQTNEKLEIRPPGHLEILSQPSYLKRFCAPTLGLPITFWLLSIVPGWLCIPILMLGMYAIMRVSKTMRKTNVRDTFFLGWWWGSIISCYSAYIYALLPYDKWWLVLLQFISSLIMFISWYATVTGDPGYLYPNGDDEIAILDLAAKGEIDDKHYCRTCLLKKPLRSKHDRLTNRCVSRFDHYCTWLNVPVGFKNHRTFMFFCYFHWLCQLIFIISAFTSLVNRFGFSFETFFVRNPGTTYLFLIYNPIIMFGVTFLCYGQTHQILRNVTTNEAMQPYKYPWLIIADKDDFISLFDNGNWNNWNEFWKGTKDYGSVYFCKPPEKAKKWCAQKNINCPPIVGHSTEIQTPQECVGDCCEKRV